MAAALTLGTAAVLTGTDRQKIVDLPNLAGMKSEVIIQKAHRNGYDHAARTTGIRMVEVETAAVTSGPFEATIDEDAKTHLADRYVVSAPLSGRLGRIALREGGLVEGGVLVHRRVCLSTATRAGRSGGSGGSSRGVSRRTGQRRRGVSAARVLTTGPRRGSE